MRFELTPEIVDQVIFAMENQETPFRFDSETRTVVDDFPNGAGDGERFIEIPGWSSADGFQLMERFVATLRNPLVREKLREALGGGKGVFRNFKNTLKEHGEVERLWFSFKDREMRSKVVGWYNDLCDIWGLERINPEPDEEEETDELVLSDFQIEEDTRGIDLVRAYDREAWDEALEALPPAIVEFLYRRSRADADPASPGSLVVSARTPSGDFAGFVWGVAESDAEGAAADSGAATWMRIEQLFVTKEFRGLGISKTLVEHICNIAYSRGVSRILIDIAGSGEVLMHSLQEAGFIAFRHGLALDVEQWGQDNIDP